MKLSLVQGILAIFAAVVAIVVILDMENDGKGSDKEQAGTSSSLSTISTPKRLKRCRSKLFESPKGSTLTQRSPLHRKSKELLENAKKRKRRSDSGSPFRLMKTPKKAQRQVWTKEEMVALVEFVAMPNQWWNVTSSKGSWPGFKDGHQYWTECSKHVSEQSGQPRRADSKIRTRVTRELNKQFPGEGGVSNAEKAFGITVDSYIGATPPHEANQSYMYIPDTPTLQERSTKLFQETSSVDTPSTSTFMSPTPTQSIHPILAQPLLTSTPRPSSTDQLYPYEPPKTSDELLHRINTNKRLATISSTISAIAQNDLNDVANYLYWTLSLTKGVNTNVFDFASLSTDAMARLQQAKKPNLIYKYAFCIGTNRPDSSEPKFSFDRMPFGLVQHQIEFFSVLNTAQIGVPTDYRQWQLMMEIEFGKRFNKLFRGPCWSGCKKEEVHNPFKARVNVAAMSRATMTNEIAEGDATPDSQIQTSVLELLQNANPNGRFWLKLDGTDLKVALQESKQREWNGDSELGGPSVSSLRQCYDRRLMTIFVDADLPKCIEDLAEDKLFLKSVLKRSGDLHDNLKDSASTKKSRNLSWDIVEATDLLQKAENLKKLYQDTMEKDSIYHVQIMNANKSEISGYLRNLFKKRRVAASHVLVVMLADEQRNRKPYCMPIQFIPYKSITDNNIRNIVKDVIVEMQKYGLTCVGTVTDGEFNTLCTRGRGDRPLHLYQLIQDIRKKVDSMLMNRLKDILKRNQGNEPIPSAVKQKIMDIQAQGSSFNTALKIVRADLVPVGYVGHPWRLNAPETPTDLMKTIVATYRFRAEIQRLQMEGVDFSRFLYNPEKCPETGNIIHHREDHCHILKRLAKHLRDDKFQEVDSVKFKEALDETDRTLPKSGLTEAAVKGTCRQSVADAERLLSHAASKYMSAKGFYNEAEYVKVIADWHEASDGRGVSQPIRSAANANFKAYIMRRWMPWYDQNKDLSSIDINVRIDKLCGFSRETVISVTTNIDSQEHRRLENDTIGFAEHPRSGTTDDVELFFSLLHNKTKGQHTTLKEFKHWWRKLVLEFQFKMDDTLPFYFHTLSERFNMDERPTFDEPGEGVSRLHNLPLRSREDNTVAVAGRSVLPQRNETSIRTSIHKPLVPVAPLTSGMKQIVNDVINEDT